MLNWLFLFFLVSFLQATWVYFMTASRTLSRRRIPWTITHQWYFSLTVWAVWSSCRSWTIKRSRGETSMSVRSSRYRVHLAGVRRSFAWWCLATEKGFPLWLTFRSDLRSARLQATAGFTRTRLCWRATQSSFRRRHATTPCSMPMSCMLTLAFRRCHQFWDRPTCRRFGRRPRRVCPRFVCIR